MSDHVHPSQFDSPSSQVSPLHEVWSIAWPTILTMTSYTIMQFMDKLMVGQVGPLELTAQSNGGIWAFTPLAWIMGALTVINTYVAQNLGANRPENGPKYAWTGLWMSLFAWIFLMLPMALCLPLLFSQMSDHSDELRKMETGYGQILLAGSLILLGGRAISHYFFGMHRPKVITIATVSGNTVNVLANYVLIFGDQGMPQLGLPGVPGMPAMGVYGAAIGTIIGTGAELAIPMAVFLGPKLNRQYKTRSAWRLQLKPMWEVLKLGWPAAIQWGNEIICWSLFLSVIVGRFGEEHMAAGWIALTYMHLSFMPAVGMSVATNSLVGKYIGAGQPDIAVSRARLALKLAIAYMTLCGLIFYLGRHGLVSIFVGGQDLDPEDKARIIAIGGRLMICAAVFQTFDAFGIIYTGALRGAGDTLWPSFATIIYSWSFIVAGGWALAVYVPQLESVGPWIGAAVFIICYGVTMALRFESGGWRSIKLLDPDAEDGPDFATMGPAPPAITPDAAVRDLADEIGETLTAPPGETSIPSHRDHLNIEPER